MVAPLSGHFPTRLRGTIEALLPDHDVHVTDWADARGVPAAAGGLGLDEQVAHLMEWLEALGPGAHLLAVSQPAVAALAATALLAEDGNPARPRSLTIIAGPVDPRIEPTHEGALARALPLAWFRRPRSPPCRRPSPAPGGRCGRVPSSSPPRSWPTSGASQGAAPQLRNLAEGDQAAAAAHRRAT